MFHNWPLWVEHLCVLNESAVKLHAPGSNKKKSHKPHNSMTTESVRGYQHLLIGHISI